MKKALVSCMIAFMLALAAGNACAAGNPVEQLTGKVWMESGEDVKKSVIFGVECAITIEYFIAEKMAEKEMAAKKTKKQAPTNLSPFEKGWMTAFKDVPRTKIVEDIDAWYKANPDKLNETVFKVIWDQLIAPKLKAR